MFIIGLSGVLSVCIGLSGVLSVYVLLAIAQPFGYLSKIIVCSLHLPPCISLKSNGAKGLTVKIVCYSSCCDLFTVHSQTIYIYIY